MRAHSAVFVPHDWSRRSGSVEIAFASYHGEGSDLGLGVLRKVRYSPRDAQGPFEHGPAYMVHIREAKTEDRTRGSHGSETDWLEINSECSREKLEITWNTHGEGEILEIGYFIVGE